MDPLSSNRFRVGDRTPPGASGSASARGAVPAPPPGFEEEPPPLDQVQVHARPVPRRRILADWLRRTARGALDTAAYMVGAGLGELVRRSKERSTPGQAGPKAAMAPLSTRLQEGAALVHAAGLSAKGMVQDLARPPLGFGDRVSLRALPHGAPVSSAPCQELDQAFCDRILRSGWQGQSVLVAGDVEDGTLLAWTEEGPSGRSLHLRGYLTEEGHRKVQARFEEDAWTGWRRSALEVPRLVLDEGVLRQTGDTFRLPGGRRVERTSPEGVQIRYFPHVEDYHPNGSPAAPPASVQGQLELRLDGARVCPEELRLLLDVLRGLGAEATPATAQDLELQYLRQMARALEAGGREFEKGLSARTQVGEQVGFARRFLSQHLGIEDVASLPDYDWRPHFDTLFAGRPEPGQGGGWAHWNRFDAPLYLGAELAEHRLTHHVHGDVGASVAAMIVGSGGLQATEERLGRLGMDAVGISSLKDRRSGGARYVFTHLERNPRNATLVFSQDLLRRADQVGFRPGCFGHVHSGREARKTPLEAYHRTPIYEVMLKNSVSFIDSLEQVNLPSERDRDLVLAAFARVGIQEIRGVPVEEVVRVSTAS